MFVSVSSSPKVTTLDLLLAVSTAGAAARHGGGRRSWQNGGSRGRTWQNPGSGRMWQRSSGGRKLQGESLLLAPPMILLQVLVKQQT